MIEARSVNKELGELTDEEKEALLELEKQAVSALNTSDLKVGEQTLEMEVVDVNISDYTDIKSNFPEACIKISTPIASQEKGSQVFLLSKSHVQELTELCGLTEDMTSDFLDKMVNTYIQGFSEEFSNFLKSPEFLPSTAEAKELVPSDLPSESPLRVDFLLKINGKEFPITKVMSFDVVTGILDPDSIDTTSTAQPEKGDKVMVQEVKLDSFEGDENSSNNTRGLDVLYDLKLSVSVELGRTYLMVKDILQLGCDSIIELDKLAGDPVDLYVNDKKLAEGEVVVVDDHFGVRITNLVKPSERIQSLGDS